GMDAIFAGGPTSWRTIAGSNTQAIIYKDQAGNLIFYLDNNGAANTNYSPSERYRITLNGNMLINTTSDDATNKLQVNGSVKATQFRLSALNTAPTSSTDTGTTGEIRIVNGFIYVCVATNTW